MELHQLRYFVAVADFGSFTKAAAHCLIAQPSLSQQVIKLEKELGVPLLERLGRSVQLTDSGRLFYEQAVRILADVEEARQRVSDPSNGRGGTIAIGAIPTVAPFLLPPLVSAFRDQFPQASVIIHENLTEHTIENCLRGQLAVGIVALPVSDSHLHVEPLFEEELLLVVPAGHRLTKQRKVTIQDLNGEPFILLSEMHCLGQQIVSFCDKQSCTPFISCQSVQLQTIQHLVSAGHGVSLLPALARKWDDHPKRHYRSLSGTRPTRTLAMIWHRQRYQPPLVRKFIELVREQGRKPTGNEKRKVVPTP